jgi:hypothetical protein
MAKVRNNATDRVSGKVDQFVYRNWYGQTVMARKPDESRKAPSENQENVRDRFRLAVQYAKAAMSDPLMKAFYASKATPGKSAYNMALADFFDAPRIKDINTAGYSGNTGDRITVTAVDSFKVNNVHLKITRPDGSLVEQGEAILGSVFWEYSCTTNNVSFTGCIVTVTAFDIPGNATIEQKNL